MKIIMANILPAHVAEVFKERNRHDQLYYENFDKVAVMFASIENCEVDTMGLRALHEFICFFDDLLATYHNKYKIEKIKVMGWTYMVACGLEVDHGADSSLNIPRVSELSSDRRRSNGRSASRHLTILPDHHNFIFAVSVRFGSLEQGEATSVHSQTNEHDDDDMAVIVMADFALGLLRIMRKIQEALKGNLKIGKPNSLS